MKTKNKLKELFHIFIRPFSILVLFSSIVVYILNLEIKVINPLILYFIVGLTLWGFFFYFKRMSEDKLLKRLLTEFAPGLFFSSILFSIILNLIPSLSAYLPSNTMSLVGFVVIISGIVVYSQNDKMTEPKGESEINEEKTSEQKREDHFQQKFKKLNNIPILSSFVRFFYKEGWFYSTSLILVTSLFLVFGLNHLGKFMSVDEPKWVDTRVPQLFEALRNQDWANTYINDKPGILPAFLSGAINIFLDPDYYKNNPLLYQDYLFGWRLPILIFNFLMLFLIYRFSKDLLNKNKAILITGFIALNPILLGISQIVNPDSTLWSTAFLSFLTFFLYIKTNQNKYIWFSGIFLGLSLISKYSVSIFYIFFFSIIYLEYLLKITDLKSLQKRFYDLIKLSIISMGIYTILFPATWIDFSQILKGTIEAKILSSGSIFTLSLLFLILAEIYFLKGKITEKIKVKNYLLIVLLSTFYSFLLFLLINALTKYSIFNPESYTLNLFQRGNVNLIENLMTSGYTTLFTITPPILLGIILLPFTIFKQKHKNTFETLIVTSILFIIFLYIGGTALGGFIATARYQILLYPFYVLLASIALSQLTIKKEVLIFISFSWSIILLYNISPFSFTYTNILNIQKTPVNDTWGLGGYEVAQILNKQISETNDLTIWSDREGVNEFFIGKKYWRGKDNPFNLEDIDLLVLTRGGEKIFRDSLKTKQGKYYAIAPQILYYYEKNPEWKYCIPNNPKDCYKIVKFEPN